MRYEAVLDIDDGAWVVGYITPGGLLSVITPGLTEQGARALARELNWRATEQQRRAVRAQADSIYARRFPLPA